MLSTAIQRDLHSAAFRYMSKPRRHALPSGSLHTDVPPPSFRKPTADSSAANRSTNASLAASRRSASRSFSRAAGSTAGCVILSLRLPGSDTLRR